MLGTQTELRGETMSEKQVQVKTALISVFDKTGLVVFARELKRRRVRILSTGNTARTLREAGIEATEVSEITDFPEMLDGRVKTLHPKIHGGILARRDKKSHLAVLAEHGIPMIDLVVISLYPFEQVRRRSSVREEIIEMIDIGGPTMLRAAAKNMDGVGAVCDTADYGEVLRELDRGKGTLSAAFRRKLAMKVFAVTSAYDTAITDYLAGDSGTGRKSDAPGALPANLSLSYRKAGDLRYGENPHQKAALYRSLGGETGGLSEAEVLGGKELSYNNYLDLEAAWSLVSGFKEGCACVVKHNNPCGFAIHPDRAKAFKLAFAGDPLSAFGGIVGTNRRVDAALAKAILEAGFLECVVAPAFDAQALKLLREKKNLRLVAAPRRAPSAFDFKKIQGGLLVQTPDQRDVAARQLKTVTLRHPAAKQMSDLLTGFKLLRFIKSNAIVIVKDGQAVGIGMGQPSRVDSVHTAIRKAGKRAKGAILASDGFFPKPDSIRAAAKHGISAIIQPGGSIKDAEVIAGCDKAKIAMVLTGVRHFTH